MRTLLVFNLQFVHTSFDKHVSHNGIQSILHKELTSIYPYLQRHLFSTKVLFNYSSKQDRHYVYKIPEHVRQVEWQIGSQMD